MGLLTPNTQKDLPTSPRLGARPFWGGFGGMGVTPVHTTLIPHTPVGVKGVLQENINPALQRPGSVVEKNANAHLNGLGMGMGMGGGLGAFDAFADTNPFTLKTLDAYRMQLWGKMAAQQAHVPSSGMGMGMGNMPHGLTSNLKPAYFASTSTSSSLSSKSLAGKTAYPSPPASPAPGAGFKGAAAPTREQAALAAIASQTLLGKLGSAFWEAFSGSEPKNGTGPGNGSDLVRKDWDADKVRKVLEGRAVVRVVDVEHQIGRSPSPSSSMEKTVERKPSSVEGCKVNMCDILEESMRSLTISKK
jgi:bZIP-type transcription factor MBZ1